MDNVNIEVSIKPQLGGDHVDALRSEVTEAITGYVRRRGDEIQNGFLHAIITQCECTNSKSIFAVVLRGELNGQSIVYSASVTRTPSAVHGAAGAAGGFLLLAVIAVIAIFVPRVLKTSTPKRLVQCFNECMAELSAAMDSSLGLRESAESNAWHDIIVLRWAPAVVLPVLLAAPVVMRIGELGLLAIIFPGLIFGAAGFWLIHVGGLLFMPTRFFVEDPRGMKALARSGVGNVIGLRLICLVLALVFVGVLFLGLVFSLMAFSEPVKFD